MLAQHRDSMSVLFARVFWMMLGPAVLLLSAIQILRSPGSGWLTGGDLVYGVALIGMMLGRFVEHLGGNPRTSIGAPSTSADLSRYVIVVAIAGSAAWVGLNLLSNHLLL